MLKIKNLFETFLEKFRLRPKRSDDMKRIITLLCGAVLTGSLAACAVSDQAYYETGAPSDDAVAALLPSEFSETDFDATGDVVLATEYETCGSNAPEVFYTIKNNTSNELMYGEDFAVEVLLEGKWYQVPFQKNTAWNTLGLVLKADETNTGSFAFSALDYTLKDGTYRLIKTIGEKRYFAEFSIGVSPITADSPYGYTALEKLPQDYSVDEAVKNDDVVITYNEIKNAGRLTEFIDKISIGISAMIRFVQYTIEGDPIISDITFHQGWQSCFFCRNDSTRDEFGGGGKITETIYSFIITDGTDLYLSNCASWEMTETYPNADVLQISWAADQGDLSDLVGAVQKMTEKRLEGNWTRYKVYSPSGEQSVFLSDEKLPNETDGKIFYGYEKPGFGDTLSISDPDGIATAITDVIWLDDQTYVLICDTSGSLRYFEVIGNTQAQSGYGAGYKIVDGHFEILE
jgi:hypothetical protein